MTEDVDRSFTGADLISAFIAKNCFPNVFLVTGGACAFIVDAIGRNPSTTYTCFQHEQGAAMAADAVWRTSGKIGVTLATSGPGATNLITGIACSWFDSIPSLHFTGQVNQSESREAIGANVRQAGFQETDIVSMVKSITKFAKKIESIEDLAESLPRALATALTGRMGPVLLDVPMNIQKEKVSEELIAKALSPLKSPISDLNNDSEHLKFLESASRPMVLIGAGAALSGKAAEIQKWCETNKIPYVSSWGALTYLNRSLPGYQGSIGVYGSRHANWAIQSADKVLVLGSRLDNRQRTGNPNGFAPNAQLLVIDVDPEELKKYSSHRNYLTELMDIARLTFKSILAQNISRTEWLEKCLDNARITESGFSRATEPTAFNPYFAVQEIQKKFSPNAIVASDCGANLCWVYQAYLPDSSFLFTAGGNSPMGYSLPAAIGAKLANPNMEVWCFIGDGGIQMNLQELQTIIHYGLDIKIVIQNNFGYGIIKQFQDAYFESRYFATGAGYSVPNFENIANAYGITYAAIKTQESLIEFSIPSGATIIDLHHPQNALISPKTEMDRFIHDQFPYLNDGLTDRILGQYPKRPSELSGPSNPTV
jgi:acetolactate synthase-1/2/3 large subunit